MATYGCEIHMQDIDQTRSEVWPFATHQADLIRFATALVGPSDAADVVSDAVESLLRGGQLRKANNPLSLLYSAVMKKATSFHRSRYRRRAREERFADRILVQDPELRPDVVRAVLDLSPRQRACVYLTYWEDLSPATVAQRLGIGEGTVKRYLARARATLREVLDE